MTPTTASPDTAAAGALQTVAAPLGRVLLALIFILAGYQKIGGYAGVQGYMEAMGVPGALLPLVIALELLGGLALLLGYKARLAALLLGGFTLVSGILFHLLPGLGMEGMAAQNEINHFLKNLAIAGGMGLILAFGAGPVSLDRRSGTD
ncbi:MAG: DoxX family protein [Paracoccaceae bacterium]